MINMILSWVGVFLVLVGIYFIGNKNKVGFYIAMTGEILWIVWGLFYHAHALVVMSAAFVVMYVRAIHKWKQDEVSTIANDTSTLK